MTSRLIIMTGKHQGKKMALVEGCNLVIARDEGVAVRLATSEVSRRHCAIRIREGVATVEDLGSRNGTQINDVSIADKTALQPGDVLRVGPMLFQYEVKMEAAAAARRVRPACGPPPLHVSPDERHTGSERLRSFDGCRSAAAAGRR